MILLCSCRVYVYLRGTLQIRGRFEVAHIENETRPDPLAHP